MMESLGFIIVVVGVVLFIWVASGPARRQKKSGEPTSLVAEGKITRLKEWLHEGHRRCQVEYTYQVPNLDSGETKTLKGQSNCLAEIYDNLELNAPLKILYLPKTPEFSRPLFEEAS